MTTQGSPVTTEYENMKIAEAVLAYLEESGPATPKEIAEGTGNLAGSVRPTVRRMAERGEIAELPEWQRSRQGEYDLPDRVDQSRSKSAKSNKLENPETNSDVEGIIEYPLGKAGAGPGRKSTNEQMAVDKRLMRSQLGRVPSREEGFWSQVNGDSMSPWLEDGSYVFALRQDHVDVPGRYIIWWGEHDADICCYLAKMGGDTLLVRKYGPEKEYRLRHVEGEMYETPGGQKSRLKIRGRVVWPKATAQSVLETVTDQMSKMLSKAIN